MFPFKRDDGGKRGFEYADELKMCPSGKIVRYANLGPGEEARRIVVDALYQTAILLERDADELRREGRRVLDDNEPFGPMVSGS